MVLVGQLSHREGVVEPRTSVGHAEARRTCLPVTGSLARRLAVATDYREVERSVVLAAARP